MTSETIIDGRSHQIMAVLSTAHIDEATSKVLSELRDKNPWCSCAEWVYGYFLYLEDLEDAAPKCLHDICQWLKANGFSDCWVRLDRDEPEIDDLPTYDW